ncbi:exported hypothetical protein [uncultured Alphaproteobacteria bacterium]|uniref:Lipoprotein n=1 Tax=uncultured Alphaproteobacteria bacterium TaxID=91750 RepID=A0A212JWM1_9PROT|nr:exported hypothetical protein [uncultured Alphaproteobacteria bacterium]
MIRSFVARVLRGPLAVVALAALGGCSVYQGFPRDDVTSVGVAATCGNVMSRDYYDLAYPANSNHGMLVIKDWELAAAARERVKAALPGARVGELEVNSVKLVITDMLRGNAFASAAEQDYARAFSGDVDSYDYLLAIIPSVSGPRNATYKGVGIRSRRGGTFFGTIDSKVEPLEAYAACRAILYDRRSGRARSAFGFASEPLPGDIPATTALDYYPPDTVARFRDPLDRMIRKSVDAIMPQLVADPQPKT